MHWRLPWPVSPVDIGDHGQDDDAAGDQSLGGLSRPDLGQAGLQNGDDQHAQERSEHRALAAQEAGAADDDRGDRRELHADPAIGIGRG